MILDTSVSVIVYPCADYAERKFIRVLRDAVELVQAVVVSLIVRPLLFLVCPRELHVELGSSETPQFRVLLMLRI